MEITQLAVLPVVSRALVVLGWFAFFLFFLGRRKPPEPEKVRKRALASWAGIALQGLGITLVWMLQRPFPRAGAPLSPVEISLDVLAPIVSFASAWFGIRAARRLGKQWSYTARLVEGHALITDGPYGIVRHPIYAAMFGKLIATSFAFGHWLGLVAGSGLFAIGTVIRIRAEEKLMREAFGSQYDDYARRVPGFIPFLL